MTRWLRGISRDHLRVAFRDYFGVQDNHADVLVTLFQAGGRCLGAGVISREVSSHRPLSSHAVMEKIRALRAAMATEAIDTTTTGYSLTEIGLDECRKAVLEMATQLGRLSFTLEIEPLSSEREARRAEAVRCSGRMCA